MELQWPESETYCLFQSSADFKNVSSSLSLLLVIHGLLLRYWDTFIFTINL